MTILCFEKCNTCKKALDWLDDNNIAYTERQIDEERPTEAELTKWIAMSGLPVKRFFNATGRVYRENNMRAKIQTMSDKELIEILADDGMMVKRPLLVKDDKVLVGFKEDEWKEAFK